MVNSGNNNVEGGDISDDIDDIIEQLGDGDDPRRCSETENSKTSFLLVRHFDTEQVELVMGQLGTHLESGGGGRVLWCFKV